MQRHGHCLFVALIVAILSACTPPDAPTSSYQVANHSLLTAGFSSNGRVYFIGAMTDGGSLWDTKTQARLYDWNHTKNEFSAISAVSFSANNHYAATASGKSLALWNVGDGSPARYWQAPTRITSLEISENAGFALLGQEDNEAVMFNLRQGGVVGSLKHTDSVSSVAIDNQASKAITGTRSGEVHIWSLDTGKSVHRWSQSGTISLTEFSTTASLALVAADQGTVEIWDVDTANRLHLLYTKNPGLTTVAFSTDEHQLLVGTSRAIIELWDLQNGEKLRSWRLPEADPWHKPAVLAVTFGESPTQFLAIASDGVNYLLE
ncbi:MAG: WD40 repeat protein [Candidatus Azotimanducaceae bacterium]|jgi:WD40 repeat protein